MEGCIVGYMGGGAVTEGSNAGESTLEGLWHLNNPSWGRDTLESLCSKRNHMGTGTHLWVCGWGVIDVRMGISLCPAESLCQGGYALKDCRLWRAGQRSCKKQGAVVGRSKMQRVVKISCYALTEGTGTD